MTVKQYLYSVRDEQKEIEEIGDRIYELEMSLLPGAMRYDVDRVQTSPSDRMSEVEAKIDEYIRTMQAKLRPLIERKIRAERLIDSLEDSRQRQALSLYFLSSKRMSMEDVGAQMGYSRSRAYVYWSDGLEILEGKNRTEKDR